MSINEFWGMVQGGNVGFAAAALTALFLFWCGRFFYQARLSSTDREVSDLQAAAKQAAKVLAVCRDEPKPADYAQLYDMLPHVIEGHYDQYLDALKKGNWEVVAKIAALHIARYNDKKRILVAPGAPPAVRVRKFLRDYRLGVAAQSCVFAVLALVVFVELLRYTVFTLSLKALLPTAAYNVYLLTLLLHAMAVTLMLGLLPSTMRSSSRLRWIYGLLCIAVVAAFLLQGTFYAVHLWLYPAVVALVIATAFAVLLLIRRGKR